MTLRLLNEPIRYRYIDIRNELGAGFRADTFTSCHSSSYPEPQAKTARAYDDEKETFSALRVMLQARYPGEYVAIAGGEIYGHDPSRLRLAQRFFGERGHGPVYIGFVGPRPVIRIPTPFIRRRR